MAETAKHLHPPFIGSLQEIYSDAKIFFYADRQRNQSTEARKLATEHNKIITVKHVTA
jgi:hypothetical protein